MKMIITPIIMPITSGSGDTTIPNWYIGWMIVSFILLSIAGLIYTKMEQPDVVDFVMGILLTITAALVWPLTLLIGVGLLIYRKLVH